MISDSLLMIKIDERVAFHIYLYQKEKAAVLVNAIE
jgi:hypothetical protein